MCHKEILTNAVNGWFQSTRAMARECVARMVADEYDIQSVSIHTSHGP